MCFCVCSLFFCDGSVVVNVDFPALFHPHNAMMMLVGSPLWVPKNQGPQKRQPKKLVSRKRIQLPLPLFKSDRARQPKKLVSRKRIAVSAVQKQQSENGAQKNLSAGRELTFFFKKNAKFVDHGHVFRCWVWEALMVRVSIRQASESKSFKWISSDFYQNSSILFLLTNRKINFWLFKNLIKKAFSKSAETNLLTNRKKKKFKIVCQQEENCKILLTSWKNAICFLLTNFLCCLALAFLSKKNVNSLPADKLFWLSCCTALNLSKKSCNSLLVDKILWGAHPGPLVLWGREGWSNQHHDSSLRRIWGPWFFGMRMRHCHCVGVKQGSSNVITGAAILGCPIWTPNALDCLLN
jgi:hypothetical protein